jgi:hypothetical protein
MKVASSNVDSETVGEGSGVPPTVEVGATDQLWASPDLASAVFDVLPDVTAVIDRSGTTVATNRSWTNFAVENQGEHRMIGVGVN